MSEIKEAVDFWLSFKVDIKKAVKEWCGEAKP
jgi:hypothetical protein